MHDHVGGQQLGCLHEHGALDPVGEKADRRHAGDRHDQRCYQDAELAGVPFTPESEQRQAKRA